MKKFSLFLICCLILTGLLFAGVNISPTKAFAETPTIHYATNPTTGTKIYDNCNSEIYIKNNQLIDVMSYPLVGADARPVYWNEATKQYLNHSGDPLTYGTNNTLVDKGGVVVRSAIKNIQAGHNVLFIYLSDKITIMPIISITKNNTTTYYDLNGIVLPQQGFIGFEISEEDRREKYPEEFEEDNSKTIWIIIMSIAGIVTLTLITVFVATQKKDKKNLEIKKTNEKEDTDHTVYKMPIGKMRCLYCGVINNSDSKFCTECGANIKNLNSNTLANTGTTNQKATTRKSTAALVIKLILIPLVIIICLLNYKVISFSKKVNDTDLTAFQLMQQAMSIEKVQYYNLFDNRVIIIETSSAIYYTTISSEDLDSLISLAKILRLPQPQKITFLPIYVYAIIELLIIFIPRPKVKIT